MYSIDIVVKKAAAAWSMTPEQARSLLSLPRHRCVRINTLKARKATIADLTKDGIQLEPLPWAKDCYNVTAGYEKLSQHPTVDAGEIFLQNAASFVPVIALDPQPNNTVLDMCAAPGGKTTHIAALSRNKAIITANDTSRTRFFKMREIFSKYSVQADTTLIDGRTMRKHFNKLFQKILLDAPCSGEAAIDPNNQKSYAMWSPAKVKRLSRLQEQLIVVAYDLLQPGGILVYSTCTISPEENELVIQYLLKRRDAQILPITVDVPDSRPGLTYWKDKQLQPDIAKTIRLLPSINHEAFFTAKIIKPLHSKDSEDTYRL